ncbi:MAG: aspartate-semialdehyde dehydrogenase, partial [Planctomycetota bacterium]
MSFTQPSRWIVVGATGVVGAEMLSLLAARGVPADNVSALGSERSAGRSVSYGSHSLHVEAASSSDVPPGAIVLLAVGA